MYTDVSAFCVTPQTSLRDAIGQIDRSRLGIVLVVDEARRLVGTITDGDVRRAILAGMDLGQPTTALLTRKAGTKYARPITASIAGNQETWLRLMEDEHILHLPLVDKEQRVAGLATLVEFVPKGPPIQALIMAGGAGQRLRPLTNETPKPMLAVGDRPLLEIMIQQLRDAGIERVHIATHHQPEKISQHFGDGQEFGVNLSYVTEEKPLGTVGALGLMEPPKETLLVINGDILTKVDFRSMVTYHREHGGDLTVGVRHYEIKVPYGVIECEESMVCGVSEKPVLGFFVNAGIYLLEPIVHRFIPNGQPLDMPDLIRYLLNAGRQVVSFPVREYWMDIGQHADYQHVQEEIKRWESDK